MATVRVIFALASLFVVVSCAHAPDVCETGRFSTSDQKQADRVLVALTSSPTWEADLQELRRDTSESKLVCYVRADEELLMQIANLSTSDSFVVEPHLAAGIERAREWLKNSTAHNAGCTETVK